MRKLIDQKTIKVRINYGKVLSVINLPEGWKVEVENLTFTDKDTELSDWLEAYWQEITEAGDALGG